MQTTLSKFQSILRANNLDGFIVTNSYNILYLSGFRGISPTEREAILTITQDYATLITARLYQAEAKKLNSSKLTIKIAAERNEIDNFLKNSLKNTKKVGFEENDLKYAEFTKYKKLLSPTKLVPSKKLIENLRVIKSESEIQKIEKVQIISQNAFEKILPTLKVGQTELEIAHTLKAIIHTLGGEGTSFDPIIASGPNSGIPHHVTGKRSLKIGDTLLFDFGAKYQNYCADFSRTIFIGKASEHQRNIFNHVLKAQKKALAKIKHGVKHHEPFHSANNHFKENKLEKYFTHGLGHGIGLEVHEAPYLRSTINNQQLTNHMVFSVEPGLYFNWGGVRIEDLVTIKNGKTKVLGKLTERLIEINP